MAALAGSVGGDLKRTNIDTELQCQALDAILPGTGPPPAELHDALAHREAEEPPADPLAGLEHGNRSPLLDQTVSCRQTGNSGTDNDDIDTPGAAHGAPRSCRRRSRR